jgi:hypothetical protein
MRKFSPKGDIRLIEGRGKDPLVSIVLKGTNKSPVLIGQ